MAIEIHYIGSYLIQSNQKNYICIHNLLHLSYLHLIVFIDNSIYYFSCFKYQCFLLNILLSIFFLENSTHFKLCIFTFYLIFWRLFDNYMLNGFETYINILLGNVGNDISNFVSHSFIHSFIFDIPTF